MSEPQEKEKKRRFKRKHLSENKIDRPKRERRTRDVLDEGEQPVTWTIKDKEKLLEALYRHSPSTMDSISALIDTKTTKQVEDFIEKKVNSSYINKQQMEVEDKGEAPLELWLSVMQELVHATKNLDHSQQYSKMLNVVVQNEPMPDDSGIPKMKWKNLYQFISDLLEDKTTLQPLTNLESLVMLDLMHSLGKNLHSSDLKEQRRFLDLKYQLYRWQSDNPSKQFTASLKAFYNDFTDLEYHLTNPLSKETAAVPTALASTSSSSSSLPQMSALNQHSVQCPSTSSQHQPCQHDAERIDENTTAGQEEDVSTRQALLLSSAPLQIETQTNSFLETTATTTTSSLSQHISPISACQLKPVVSDMLYSQQDQTNEQIAASSLTAVTEDTETVAEASHRSGEDAERNTNSITSGKSVTLDVEDFVLPKLFSLNPLTIPASLLSLQSKNKD